MSGLKNGSNKLSVSKDTAVRRKKRKSENVRRKTSRMTRQTRERMDDVTSLLSECVPYGEIERKLSEKWGVKRGTVKDYIHRVHDELNEQVNDPEFRTKRRDHLRLMWQNLYIEAKNEGNHAAAAQCLKEMGNLDGCYAPKEMTVDAQFAGVGLSLASLGLKSAAEVRKRIKELEDRLANGGPASLNTLHNYTDAEIVEDDDSEPKALVAPDTIKDSK